MTHRIRRTLLVVAAILAAGWFLAWGGYLLAKNTKVTAEKVRARLSGLDLTSLPEQKRAGELRDLAGMVNALPAEARREARMDGEWQRLFAQMNDREKGEFIEATLPSGFRQMMQAFEQMPQEKRLQAVEEATRRLREAREGLNPPTARRDGANPPPELGPELREKVVKVGLKAFYTESSAQTKAELAPLMEELQRALESGRVFRRGP